MLVLFKYLHTCKQQVLRLLLGTMREIQHVPMMLCYQWLKSDPRSLIMKSCSKTSWDKQVIDIVQSNHPEGPQGLSESVQEMGT